MPTNQEEKDAGWDSVTEVLDSFIPKGLLDWYLKTGKSEAKRLSTVAMKIGTRVDELIEQDVKTKKYSIISKDSIEVKNCMEAWEAFKRDYQPDIKAAQIPLKSEKDKLVGHADLIMDDMVVDIKCASSIKPNYWLQVSKYLDMMIDMPETPVGVAILRLDKNLGTYQYMTAQQADISWTECVKIFDGLMKAYRFYRPKGSKE